jgi:hypothetical protein
VPHLSALMAGRSLPPAPIECDYSKGMPADLGFMLNDSLGDCTIAAYYHARQIWSFNAGGTEITNPESDVLKAYELICGYDPSNQTTDQGGVEQDVLTYLLNTGAPGCEPIIAFVEADPRNLDDVKRVIHDTGTAYIGVDLPQSAMSSDVWGVQPNDPIVGGHAVVCMAGDTKIPLLSGVEKRIDEMAAEGGEWWVYSCDTNGHIVPGLAHSARLTGNQKPIVKVTLDSGESFSCTKDHLIMRRDGEYTPAGDLLEGDSLMPLYRRVTGVETPKMQGYEQFLDPATQKWVFTHRRVATRTKKYSSGKTIHHANFNKRNNCPTNLIGMSWEDHTALHANYAELLNVYAKSEVGRAKSKKLMKALWTDPQWRKESLKRVVENGKKVMKARIDSGLLIGFQQMDKELLKAMCRINGKKFKGKKLSSEQIEKIIRTKKEMRDKDPELRQKQDAQAAKNLATYNEGVRNKTIPVSEAQREARKANAKALNAARWNNVQPAQIINHKVVRIEQCGVADVYDITVEEHHNFAVAAGVFVHNCVGYDLDGFDLISWGKRYRCTNAFLAQYCEEAYAIADRSWVEATGKTPLGMSLPELESQMQALRNAA